MTPELVFGMTGPPVLLGWAIVILAPRRLGWLTALPRTVIPLGLSLLYTVLVLRHFAGTGGGFDSLAAVRQLFSADWVLLAGWVHYLAFDLVVGAVLAARMDRAGIGRLVQAPVLVTTFLLGPVGFALAILTEALLAARFPARAVTRLPAPLQAEV